MFTRKIFMPPDGKILILIKHHHQPREATEAWQREFHHELIFFFNKIVNKMMRGKKLVGVVLMKT
jgi:hypothetical protein